MSNGPSKLVKGRPGADTSPGFAADGDDVIVTLLSDEGVLTSHLSNGVVRYSIGGAGDEVIATYEQTGADPPGCD